MLSKEKQVHISDWFKIGNLVPELAEELLSPADTLSLPRFVERDIYDRAVELVNILLNSTPAPERLDIIELVKNFAIMASSGTISVLYELKLDADDQSFESS